MQKEDLILAAQSGDPAAMNRLLILTRRIGGLKVAAASTGWLFTVVRRECQRLSRKVSGRGPSVKELAETRLACRFPA